MRGILDGVRAHEVSPAFVGRRSELAVLTDALRRAEAGTPGAVLIGGEAGGGKTRLVGEFAERAITDHELTGDARHIWPILLAGIRACALHPAAALAARLREVAAVTPAHGAVMTAERATFEAESARADGRPDRAAWTAAVAAWDAVGRPYPLARALLRAAEAAVADGDRDEASALLGRAAGLAVRLKARPLRADLDLIARRARLRLDGGPAGQAPLGLTPREQEVLRLLAEGRSNREIAEELFISAKTASVHVSNILAKLNVPTRGAAAAAARRLRLTG